MSQRDTHIACTVITSQGQGVGHRMPRLEQSGVIVFIGSPRSGHISTTFFLRVILIEHLSIKLRTKS